MNKFKITIFCEMTKRDYPAEVSFELVSKSYEMVKNIENSEIQVIIVGKRINYDKIIDDFSMQGADKVIVVNDDVFTDYSPSLYKKAIVEILKQEKPDIVLFGATVMGRELAPLVATELQTGLTADCTDLSITDDKKLEATRPTFGGKMNAVIMCRTFPQMATVRPNVFKHSKEKILKDTAVDFNWIDVHSEKNNLSILEFIPFEQLNNKDLLKAKIVFAGGKGLKNKNNFAKLYELAKLTGGSTGASRGAVDAGFAPPEIQIGQTGQSVSSHIYIAFGISGMAQHLAGINSCDTIIAVNNDENAPIFQHADIGIIGNAVEIIDKMVEKLKNKSLEI
ncbi:electron transfer flavoprotein subunit alpha/FixB family protein [bacterium]|nr:electron transfer flavoprotein subunit alpha/FixB family protein [bacterium]